MDVMHLTLELVSGVSPGIYSHNRYRCVTGEPQTAREKSRVRVLWRAVDT